MLRSNALSDLFTENLDDTAKLIVLSTGAGALLASSRNTSPLSQPAKRSCILSALTWRALNQQLSGIDAIEDDDPFADLTRSPQLRVLRYEITEDDAPSPTELDDPEKSKPALRSCAMDFEGHVMAWTYIREELMLGVLGGKVTVEKPDVDTGGGDTEGSIATESSVVEGDKDPEIDWRAVRHARIKSKAMSDHLREELKDFKMPRQLE